MGQEERKMVGGSQVTDPELETSTLQAKETLKEPSLLWDGDRDHWVPCAPGN